ncbi:MAG: 4-hydroxybenzoate 3-monooxygenase [Chloroflexi bacterium]|nr:4-hydroxybenzoate 3-monooxygenase [Chloroflexota bacterium]
MRTQVAIIGAGPAGLSLAHLLQRDGIECVVLENRSREYVEQRVRAGVLEQGTVDLLDGLGLGDRLHREGMVHNGLSFHVNGRRIRLNLTELSGGRSIYVYGQQEVVKDLIAAGAPVVFEAEAIGLDDVSAAIPRVHFTQDGREQVLECDFIAGCDGFHGISRQSLPAGQAHVYEREYPFAWLGILAAAPPNDVELVYARNPRGFALHSMRSLQITRLYLQVEPDEPIDNWPDDRIWDELQARLGTSEGWSVNRGPILERGITAMRSYVVEPMRFGRLLLAGDAAHIVPPTGARGMNLAMADARVMAAALAAFYADGSTTLLDRYSEDCLRRVWRAEYFSWYLTTLLHKHGDADGGLLDRAQVAELDYLASSRDAAVAFAKNYVGLETV